MVWGWGGSEGEEEADFALSREPDNTGFTPRQFDPRWQDPDLGGRQTLDCLSDLSIPQFSISKYIQFFF